MIYGFDAFILSARGPASPSPAHPSLCVSTRPAAMSSYPVALTIWTGF